MLEFFHPMTNGSNAKTREMIARVLKALTSARFFAENSYMARSPCIRCAKPTVFPRQYMANQANAASDTNTLTLAIARKNRPPIPTSRTEPIIPKACAFADAPGKINSRGTGRCTRRAHSRPVLFPFQPRAAYIRLRQSTMWKAAPQARFTSAWNGKSTSPVPKMQATVTSDYGENLPRAPRETRNSRERRRPRC